jgi:hypothetical protein
LICPSTKMEYSNQKEQMNYRMNRHDRTVAMVARRRKQNASSRARSQQSNHPRSPPVTVCQPERHIRYFQGSSPSRCQVATEFQESSSSRRPDTARYIIA